VSADGKRVGYHRCRCLGADSEEFIPVLERHTTSMPGTPTHLTSSIDIPKLIIDWSQIDHRQCKSEQLF